VGSCHKRQKPQAPTPQAPKVLTAILTLPNLNLTYTNFGVCDFSRLAVTDWRLRRWRLWFLALSNAPRTMSHTKLVAINAHQD